MKSIGIREFRDKASHYLASKEAIAIKRHGKITGFYIPVSESDQREIQTVEAALAQSG